MQRAIKRTPHSNTATVQEVKVSRLSPESQHRENITHLIPKQTHHSNDEIHHAKRQKENTKTGMFGVNLNNIMEFAQGDEFIILAVIAILIIEGNKDTLLLLALGYILVADKLPQLKDLLG